MPKWDGSVQVFTRQDSGAEFRFWGRSAGNVASHYFTIS